MSKYADMFSAAAKRADDIEREETKRQAQLKIERAEYENRKQQQEEEEQKKSVEKADNFLKKNYEVLINNTLEELIVQLGKGNKTAKKVQRFSGERSPIIFYERGLKYLEHIMQRALIEEAGKIMVSISAKEEKKGHGHEEGDNYAGVWIHDYDEYILTITVQLL